MSVFDVRSDKAQVYSKIRFADENCKQGYDQANFIKMVDGKSSNSVYICEGYNGESVRLNGAEHANDLINALHKAIKLGWLQ